MESNNIRTLMQALDAAPNNKSVPHRACICGTLLKMSDSTVRRYSGIVNFDECFCSDCSSEFKDFVRVVCLGCKTLAVLQKPSKAKTGFEFKKGACLHVEKCPSCVPGLMSFPVLEHLQFCRAQKIPTNVDKNIVQEIERKDLQAVAAARKLREELESSPSQNETTS